MKNYLLLFGLLVAVPALSQDKIIKHHGGEISVKVTAVNENSISYTYAGESFVNTIGKAAVSKIVFGSGREEIISERISVNGKDGWENVQITNNPNEIVGLVRKGEVKAKSGGYGTMRTAKGNDRKATERIKREAAELGAHVVYIISKESKGSAWTYDQSSMQSGVAYGY